MFFFFIENNDTNWFKWLLDIVSLVMGICVSVLTFYTAYLKFLCKKIRFLTYSPHFISYYGDKLSVILENQSLSSFSINDVSIVYGNKYIMQIKKYDEPLILDPLKSCKIESEPITTTDPITFSDLDKIEDKYLLIKTSRGKIYSKFRGKIKKKAELEQVCIQRKKFNDQVISDDIRYALLFREFDNTPRTIFITNLGDMSAQVTYFNSLRDQDISTKEAVESFFKTIFEPLDIPFKIIDLQENRR